MKYLKLQMDFDIVPRNFAASVKDIKLAIFQSRARAAHASNVEALKLYFYVGGYVSKKTRTAVSCCRCSSRTSRSRSSRPGSRSN